MEKFVNHSFQNWGWSSNKQFAKDSECQHQIKHDSPLLHQSSAIDEKGEEVL
jgi:hypothetical protein